MNYQNDQELFKVQRECEAKILADEHQRILFNHQNALYERLVFSEEMHERVSEEFAQILECSLT